MGPRPHRASVTQAGNPPHHPQRARWQVAAPGPVGPGQCGRTCRPGCSAFPGSCQPRVGVRGREPAGAAGALTALWLPPRTWPRSAAPSSGRRRRPWSRRRRIPGLRARPAPAAATWGAAPHRDWGPGPAWPRWGPRSRSTGSREPEPEPARTGGDAPPSVTSGTGRGPAVVHRVVHLTSGTGVAAPPAARPRSAPWQARLQGPRRRGQGSPPHSQELPHALRTSALWTPGPGHPPGQAWGFQVPAEGLVLGSHKATCGEGRRCLPPGPTVPHSGQQWGSCSLLHRHFLASLCHKDQA